MQNVNDVLPQAFDGHVQKVAEDLTISDKRLYQTIGVNDPYRKLWRLLMPLGRRSPESLALVRADFNARCDRIILPNQTASTAATVHKETSEAVQAIIDKHPKWQRSKAIREALAELQKELLKCDE